MTSSTDKSRRREGEDRPRSLCNATGEDCITASVVVPCWNVAPWLDAALDSAIAAADRLAPRKAEIICADDASTDDTLAILNARAAKDSRIKVLASPRNKGTSATRNSAMSIARGKYIFFLDPDDVVHPDWIADGVAAMEASNADWCVSPFRVRDGEDAGFRSDPLKGDYRFNSMEEAMEGYASRLIGYSFADLRRWFSGEDLFATRELGSVCRCVFRRDIIERNHIRFDETLELWEDAFFNCEYLLHVKRTTAHHRALYDYTLRSSGTTKRRNASRIRVENKFAVQRLRKRLNDISGGRLAPLYAASCVLAPIEIVATFHKSGIGLLGALKAARRYLRDPEAAQALRDCPLSLRRPLFSAAVMFLRLIRP